MRTHRLDSATYLIRDVWGLDGRLVTCQYAVKQAEARVAWFDCIEGVRFEDIEPYEVAA